MSDVFSNRERRVIAGRSRLLTERLNNQSWNGTKNPPIKADEILRKWKNQYPTDTDFTNRLRKEGISEDDVRLAVQSDLWPIRKSLPAWVSKLEKLVEHVEADSTENISRNKLNKETPFIELISSITDYAVTRLDGLSDFRGILENMIIWLANRIVSVSRRVFYVEFKSFLNYHEQRSDSEPTSDIHNDGSPIYDEFIDAMRNGGFQSLCIEYPVLSRQLIVLIEQWCDFITELYERIARDKSYLKDNFHIGGDICSLRPLTEDTHRCGRVPVRIVFSNGSVIYKPRSVRPGILFYDLIGSLGRDISDILPKTPKYLPRKEYGWMQYIDFKDIKTSDQINRYYKRMGSLIFFSYLFNANDLHFENIIANGEFPQIVDCETIFHTEFDPEFHPHPAPPEVLEVLNNSVLRTELLPWVLSNSRDMSRIESYNSISGLSGNGDSAEITEYKHPVIKAPNTDSMRVEMKCPEIDLSKKTPSMDNETYPAGDFVDDIIDGFEKSYQSVMESQDKDRSLSEIVGRKWIENIKTRTIVRPSMRYASVLQATRKRDCLRDGIQFSIEVDQLAVPLFTDQEYDNHFWPVYKAERKALSRLDVPRFESRPDDCRLWHDDDQLRVESNKSGYHAFKTRLASLSKFDRNRQMYIIQESLKSEESWKFSDDVSKYNQHRLKSISIELYEDIYDSVIETVDGHQWVSTIGAGSQFAIVPAKMSLYDGRTGIALTAAALFHATGRQEYSQFAKQVINEVIKRNLDQSRQVQHGGTMGDGSLIYSLSVISELLHQTKYQKEAVKVANTITRGSIKDCESYDITTGIAGTLLALLACYERTGDSEVLNRAIFSGERLIDAQRSINGYLVWPTMKDTTATGGFAHGVDGIGYAMARLAGATGESRFSKAARTAFEFSSDQGLNTQPQRSKLTKHQIGTFEWCWNSPGKILGRIGANQILEDESLLLETKEQINSIAQEKQSPYDHLCCGNFGRIESLLVASEVIGTDPSYARDLTEKCLGRYNQNDEFFLPGHSNYFVNPTFFKGVSGIIYTLLRLLEPSELPSVLMLE